MRSKILFLVIIGAMLAGCKSSPAPSSVTPTLTPPSNGYPVLTPGNGYPEQNQNTQNNPGYPAVTTTPAARMPTDTPDPAKTPVIIASVTHTTDGIEVITLKNITQSEQDISLYSLLNPDTQELFTFPDKSKLAAGESIAVYNGTGAYPDGKKWLDKPFLTVAGSSVQLLNQAARIMYTFTYYPE